MQYHRLLVLSTLLANGANAQWVNFPAPGTPRTRDGKPNLAAQTPRAANGKPDLSGVWHVQPTPLAEMQRLFGEHVGDANVPGMEIGTQSKYAFNILLDFKPGDLPLRPEAEEIMRGRAQSGSPGESCLPLGIPLASLLSEPIKIVQLSGLTVILYELDDKDRQIYTDGRGLPRQFDQPAWNGYSVGKWDADTLVVETAGFNDKSWLDLMGHPHGEALRIVERYHRRNFGYMDSEVTFDDPRMYTRPFTIKITYELLPDSDIFEYYCNENEKDRAHMRKQ